jgi:hypothetical protein
VLDICANCKSRTCENSAAMAINNFLSIIHLFVNLLQQ